MRAKAKSHRSCAYVVSIEKPSASADDLRSLSEYLSFLGVIGCEVIVLDASPQAVFEEHRRVLRWVARHIAVQAPFDAVRIAADVAASDRIIIAAEDVRYSSADVADLEMLLDVHEVVEPQDYVDPLPWWSGVDAARMLMHRGVDPYPDHAATFAFRRSALTMLRGFDATAAGDPVRRMAALGAEVFSALDVFVRREPAHFREWLQSRPRIAGEDFAAPAKTAFFFAFVPAMLLLALFAGLPVAAGAIAAVCIGSIVLALRGRSGAGAFFPLRACLYAPLWLVERSVSVYWALAWKLQQAAEPAGSAVAERRPRERVASGE